eukprot:TRINITY_DN14501_c0_g1_i1.p1 TRINITY_DN14501_c0_g1~~TRINITY_DN14501_c0_g1_i1.p1  ORF type:complete len:117 (-),score=26.67 TRINITY_DN14501_c0_g1_i1:174-524(-)
MLVYDCIVDCVSCSFVYVFFFQAEDGIRDAQESRGLGDVYKRQISDGQLRKEFKKYDSNNNGSLDRQEFKRAYMNMEHYGLEPTQSEVDRLFSRYGGGDRVTFDEFCVIMLNRSKM